MNRPELKPCPFCGSTKLKLESKNYRTGWTGIDARVEQETYSVRCNVCHARGGAVGGKVIKSRLDVYRDNVPNWAVTTEELKQRAIEAWNKRTGYPCDLCEYGPPGSGDGKPCSQCPASGRLDHA